MSGRGARLGGVWGTSIRDPSVKELELWVGGVESDVFGTGPVPPHRFSITPLPVIQPSTDDMGPGCWFRH